MTHIKICGIKTLPHAIAAIEAGADLLGFNFYPKSVRFIDAIECSKITLSIKEKYPNIKLVGVFVNSPIEQILTTLETCSLDFAQLHGDEPLELCATLGDKAFKAFRGISHTTPYHDYAKFRDGQSPAFLVDASVQGVYGGSGMTADWGAAALLAGKYDFLLAGGLTPENVAEAVRQVQPWGVDVASGVESSAGEKDAGKIKAFVENIKGLGIGA